MENEINRWWKKLWETRGCRFNAAKRMEMNEKWSTITINLVSVYIIAINLIIYLKNKPAILTEELITMSTISLSILVIVISIIISTRDYKIKAHKFHNCGMALSRLYDKVCLWKTDVTSVQKEDISSLISEYNTIIETYDLNHDRIDYLVFMSQNTSAYKLKYPLIFRFYVWVISKFSLLRYWVFIFLPLIVGIIYMIVSNWH